MNFQVDVIKIREQKLIPSILLTLLLMLLFYFMLSHIQLPQSARKPSDEMLMAFLEDDELLMEEKRIVKPRKREKIEEQVEREIEEVAELDNLPDDFFQIEQETFYTSSLLNDNLDVGMDISTDFSMDVAGALVLPGTAGDIGLVGDLSNLNASITAGLDASGTGSAGFHGDLGELNLGKTKNGLRPVGPGRRSNKTSTGNVNVNFKTPNIDLKGDDFLNPIIEWLRKNHKELPQLAKTQMNYARGNLSSRVSFGNDEEIFLLCKPEVPQITILFVNWRTKKFTLIKDAGFLKEAGYLKEGAFLIAKKEKRITYFSSEQKNASNESASHFNQRFWTWFDSVKK